MCSRYFIRGAEYSIQSELAVLVGQERVTAWAGEYTPECCLCPVSVQQVVDYLNEPAVSDAFDYYFGEAMQQVKPDRRCGRGFTPTSPSAPVDTPPPAR